MEKINAALFKSKQHFIVLDGLRGVAALAVVVYHFMEWVYTDYTKNFIGHGFLAVDFFFCLSGFVIAYAYDNRIGAMGIAAFFKSRLIRLHPLVILGSVLGLLALLFDPFAGEPLLYSAGRLALLFLCSVFLIPFPVMENRAFNQFGLNAPSWSLFWEYAANIIYALVLYRAGRRALALLAVVAAGLLCFVAYRSGHLMGGWGKGNFWDGGARIFYSFAAGMLVYRHGWIIKNRIGFPGLAILLLLPFVMPHSRWNWLAQAAVVLFYFPLLVSLGAGAVLSPRWEKICVVSGNISYPLYMTHYAAIWMFGNYYTHYKPGTATLFLVIPAGTILLLGFAYAVMVLYDIPVRRYLSHKRKVRSSPAKAPVAG